MHYFYRVLVLDSTNWQDSISYYSGESLNSTEVDWVSNFTRLPAGDFENLRIVKSENYLTLTNTAWIWTVNLQSGETQDIFSCHRAGEEKKTEIASARG